MNKGDSYRFNFEITLHIDDISTLYFIQEKLGMGKIRDRGNKAVFTIRAQKDIVKIIDIRTGRRLAPPGMNIMRPLAGARYSI